MNESYSAELRTIVTTYVGPRIDSDKYSPSRIWVSQKTGNNICKQFGHLKEIAGGKYMCKEDESSMFTFDEASSSWVLQATGSRNQCYPYYAEILCE